MSVTELTLAPVKPARGDHPANRVCMRCSTAFWSEGFGERICRRCKAHASWKSSVPEGGGAGRRNGAR
jgi:ribosomal protein L40E